MQHDEDVVVMAISRVFGHAPHLVESGEDVAVGRRPVGFVEAFDVGLPGAFAGMDVHQFDAAVPRPCLSDALMNSEPLSRRRRCGTPRTPTSSSKTRMTRFEGKLVLTSMRKDCSYASDVNSHQRRSTVLPKLIAPQHAARRAAHALQPCRDVLERPTASAQAPSLVTFLVARVRVVHLQLHLLASRLPRLPTSTGQVLRCRIEFTHTET